MQNLHSIGPWHTNNGSIFNKTNTVMLDEDIAILIDCDVENDYSTVLKIGPYDMVSNYFEKMINKYNLNGFADTCENMKIIKFNVKFNAIKKYNIPEFAPYGHNFTIDEICTIINWFSNHIGKQMDEFLKLSLDDAKSKIKKLQTIGF